jgi:CDP-diglyceride synthetase
VKRGRIEGGLSSHLSIDGAGFAALLLLCVMTSDASQYVSGKLLGRHQLAPVLSPKKTWEGLAGVVAARRLRPRAAVAT